VRSEKRGYDPGHGEAAVPSRSVTVRPLHAIRNRFTVPGLLVNSMPKAGTHLLMKAVGLLPGIVRTRGQITNRLAEATDASTSRDAVTIGVDWPRPVPRPALRRALARIGRGHYAQAHTMYSTELAAELAALGMKTLLILRDPRDVALSHANYVASKSQHFLYTHYQSLSESDRVLTSIVGLQPEHDGGPTLLDIGARYRLLEPWLDSRLNHTTTFERLVGPRGGGSAREQLVELEAIADHLGAICSRRRLRAIADSLFGGTATFRRGSIGGWRERLDEEHRRAIKRVAADVLVNLGYEHDESW
jgi:hypothetical protein